MRNGTGSAMNYDSRQRSWRPWTEDQQSKAGSRAERDKQAPGQESAAAGVEAANFSIISRLDLASVLWSDCQPACPLRSFTGKRGEGRLAKGRPGRQAGRRQKGSQSGAAFLSGTHTALHDATRRCLFHSSSRSLSPVVQPFSCAGPPLAFSLRSLALFR